jgi:mannose-6-phosphate isomerase-like protein (cupin superfamily)
MSINSDDSFPNPKARSIAFQTDDRHRVNLLSGPPETRFLKSGYVKLSPGESIGFHSTGRGEEIIVPISGEGEVRFPGAEPFRVSPGFLIYNPPETEHDVINTGEGVLEYIYIVAISQTPDP